MMFAISRKPAIALAALALILPLATTAHAQSEEASYQKLIDSHGPAYVTVKFVLKLKMGGMFGGSGDSENEQEITAVMIDPKGVMICSNTSLGGFAGMMGRMSKMFGEMQATPTNIKVLMGDDTEGVDAELLARDTELDLAWVQIKSPSDKGYPFIDLTKSSKAKLGQKIYALNKLGKYFGRAATVHTGRIAGMCKKPRELYLPAGVSAVGLPIFTEAGEPLGIAVMQMPDAEESENPMSMLSSLSDMESTGNGFILPADEVVKATARAKERAKEESVEKKSEDKPDAKSDEKPAEKSDPKKRE